MEIGIAFIVGVPAIIIAIVIHEFCHGYAAYLLGDETARRAGRLTLNPVAHIDLWGTIIIPLLMLVTSGAAFGWAKPVPINPYNLKFPRWGPAIVAVAGPASNFLMAVFAGIVFKMLSVTFDPQANLLMIFLVNFALLNLFLMIFNLVPIPPLDGSKVLFGILSSPRFSSFCETLERQGPILLLLLIVFDNFLNIGFFKVIFRLVISIFEKVVM